ncbi:MAG: SRPBCC family protein [Hyphomicrobiaceae bacterium]
MMHTAVVIALILLAALAVLVLLASRQPDAFEISRAIEIAAPPEHIFPAISNLATLNTWNPFNADPSIVGTYSGPADGKGAAYAFASPKAGTGSIEITEVEPPHAVTMRLVMTKPFACDNTVVYTLAPVPKGTHVTWSMSGKNSPLARLMCILMSPDRMVGGMFDKGLSDLKKLTEARMEA